MKGIGCLDLFYQTASYTAALKRVAANNSKPAATPRSSPPLLKLDSEADEVVVLVVSDLGDGKSELEHKEKKPRAAPRRMLHLRLPCPPR